MPIGPVSRPGRAFAALLALLFAAGCSDTVSLLPGAPGLPVPDIVRVVKTVDQPTNVIERGLSHCDRGRTAAGETVCLKDALAADHVTVSAIVALVPACRPGIICSYRYTTVDRVGFVPATQTDFEVRWRVDFDFRKPAQTLAGVPITVSST